MNETSYLPTQGLIDDLFRQKVLAARRMSSEEKLLAGPRLFDRVCRVMSDGSRHEHPDADERQNLSLLRERLARLHRIRDQQ